MRSILVSLLTLAIAAGPAAAQTIERLRETGELRLGYRTDALPLSFVDGAGLPAGYTVEVCKEVGEKLRAALELDELALAWVPVTPEDRFASVTEGRVDLVCGADTVTLERREIVDFSLPTFVDGAAVLMLRGAEPDLTELAGKRIGVRGATTTEDALRATLFDQGMQAEVVLFDDHAAGRDALAAGDIAAYFGDQSILVGLIQTSAAPETLMLSTEMLTVEKQALAMPRGDDAFRLAVDRALSELYISGRMQEILEEALPGIEPGLALRALFLIAPDLL